MTKGDFIKMLKLRLKNNQDPTLDQDIEREMDMVQQTLLERNSDFTPWFLMEDASTASTTKGDERIQLPSDFLAEWEEGVLWFQDSDGDLHPLHREDYQVLRQKFPGKGKPKAYTVGKDYFFLLPTPDDSYTLRMFYYGQDTLPSNLSSNDENLWLKYAADWFLGEIGQIIAPQYLGDTQAGQIFGSQLGRGRRRVYHETVERQEANKERIMGGVY